MATTQKTKRPSKAKIKPTTQKQSKEIVFDYERRQIVILTLIYAVITALVWKLANIVEHTPLASNPSFFTLLVIVMILSLLALASVVYVLNFPQRLAVLNNEGIKIDHNELLKWEDIACAEERKTGSLFHRDILCLLVKEDCCYDLTFMQKLCKHNVFTPFSIPLYAMRKPDAEKIKKLIKQRVKKYTSYK